MLKKMYTLDGVICCVIDNRDNNETLSLILKNRIIMNSKTGFYFI